MQHVQHIRTEQIQIHQISRLPKLLSGRHILRPFHDLDRLEDWIL